MTISYSRLPLHMRETARLYVERGVLNDSFLEAVVENNLKMAFFYADETNRARMHDWVMWLYNDAPAYCQGSPAKVAAWIAHNGMKGTDNDHA